MPTDFASYDLNQDGLIGQDEWDAFYANAGGAPAEPAAPVEPFNLDTFLARMSSGQANDDDLMAFQNWYMGQQMGQQARTIELKGQELDYLQQKLGLDELQLETAKQEIEFMKGPYFDFVSGPKFQHEVQKDQWERDLAGLNFETQKYLSDNQRAIADIEQVKAKDYALAQFHGTEQAKLGADAARWQYLQMLETPRPQTGRSMGGY